MVNDKYPITPEEIAQVRREIKIGQEIEFECPDPDEYMRRGKIKYRARVTEKYPRFMVCEHYKNGQRIKESVTYIDIMIGDGVSLVQKEGNMLCRI